MIKKLTFVLLCIAVPAVAAENYLVAPNESPIVSVSVPLNGKLNRSAPFTALEPGAISEAQNMKRIAPGVPAGWTARKGMTKHNTSTALNSGEDVKALFQYVNKDFGTRVFMAQVDNGTSGDLVYSADDDPPSTGTDFSSSSIYTMSAAAGVAFADTVNDDFVGAASGANPFAWSGGTAYPDGFLVTVGEVALTAPAITNDDFETGDNPPTGWTEYDTGGHLTVTTDAGSGVGGSDCMKIVADGFVSTDFAEYVYQTLTVNPNVGYEVSFYHKTSLASEFTGMKVYELNSGGGVITSHNSGAFNDTSWAEDTIALFVTNKETASLKIAFTGGDSTVGGTVYFDDVSISAYSQGRSKWRDGYSDVRNSDTTKEIAFLNDTRSIAYIGYRRRLDGVYLYLGSTKNANTATMTVQHLQDGSWSTVSNMSDGTSSGGATLAQSGAITWDYDISDDPFLDDANSDHFFWYKFTASADLTDDIEVYKATVSDDMQAVTNLSNGVWQSPDSVFRYEGTTYTDETLDVTDDDSSTVLEMATSFLDTEYVYLGCAARIFAIYIDNYTYSNSTQSAGTPQVEYWNGSAWTALTTVMDGTTDGTYAFANTGVIQWDPSEVSEDQLLFTEPGVGLYPPLPLYWYRLTVTDTSYLKCTEIAVMDKPETFPQYSGVIQYHSRALWWPGENIKSGFDYSQDGYSYIFNGSDSGQSGNLFGDGELNAIVPMGSNAVISTKKPYRLYGMTGTTPSNYATFLISDTVGTVAPHTMKFIGGGIKLFSRDTVANAVIFMAKDGFYMTDGTTVVNISEPISDYFDTSAAPYIEPSAMDDSFAWIDHEEKTVHFAVPVNTSGSGTQSTLNRELVYSYFADEWYDVYVRSNPASCGVSITGSDNKSMPYIGDYSGYVWRTDYGTADGSTEIDHYVKTTPIPVLNGLRPDYLNYKVDIRGIKLKAGADTATGSEAKITAFPDGKTTGVTVGDMSLVRAGYSYINDYLTIDSGTAGTPMTAEEIAFKFDNESVVNSIMKLYGFTVDFQLRRPTY